MFGYVHFENFYIEKNMLFDQKANLDTGGISGSGTTNHYESKVTAPRNPTLNRGPKLEPKVCSIVKNQQISLPHSLILLVYTFNIFERNVIRYSTEIIEYQRNVPTENHRSIRHV